MEYEKLSSQIELFDDKEGKEVALYEKHTFVEGVKVITYYTKDSEGKKRFWQATKDPEKLTEEERHRILDYCLGRDSYDKDEIVNYLDLFLQREFIKEISFESLQAKHEKIREILISYGNTEYGDCIIDEISEAVGLQPTTVYYTE